MSILTIAASPRSVPKLQKSGRTSSSTTFRCPSSLRFPVATFIRIEGKLPSLTRSELERLLIDTARSAFGPILPPNALAADKATVYQRPSPSFELRAHPAAEPVEIDLRNPDFESGPRFSVYAHTGTVGIGYHHAIIRWIDALGSAGVLWDPAGEEAGDSNGQPVGRDVRALARKPELNMAKRLQECLETMNVTGMGFSLCLPVPLAGMERSTVDLRLSMGVRSLDWLRAAAGDPDRARNVLAWPDPGLSPAVIRDAAICGTWLDVPWCRPCDMRTAELYGYILSLLALAHQQDPSLEMPWDEWLELALLAGAADSMPQSTRRTSHPSRSGQLSTVGPIGYRRDPQCNRLPNGVQLQLPGSMLFIEHDGNKDWFIATDGPRAVRINSQPHALPLSKEQQRAMIFTPPTPAAATEVPEHYRTVDTACRFGAAYKWTESLPGRSGSSGDVTVIQARFADASSLGTLIFVCDEGTPIDWVDTAMESVWL